MKVCLGQFPPKFFLATKEYLSHSACRRQQRALPRRRRSARGHRSTAGEQRPDAEGGAIPRTPPEGISARRSFSERPNVGSRRPQTAGLPPGRAPGKESRQGHLLRQWKSTSLSLLRATLLRRSKAGGSFDFGSSNWASVSTARHCKVAYAPSILKVRMVSQCSSIFSDSSHIELFNHIWLMGEYKVDACSANVLSFPPFRREGGIKLSNAMFPWDLQKEKQYIHLAMWIHRQIPQCSTSCKNGGFPPIR